MIIDYQNIVADDDTWNKIAIGSHTSFAQKQKSKLLLSYQSFKVNKSYKTY